MTLLDRDASFEAIDEQGRALVAACAGAANVKVPACPDWTTEDLLAHVAEVHSFWAYVVATPLLSLEGFDESAVERLAPDAARTHLLEALRAAPDDRTVWTWSSDQSAGFVRRFQVVEAAVHRADAEQAAGRSFAIPPATAVHAIAVSLETMSVPDAGFGGSVHLHCTDTEGEWTVYANGAQSTGHEKADAALRGSAQDILLALWRRAPLDALEVFGDRTVADTFVGADPRA